MRDEMRRRVKEEGEMGGELRRNEKITEIWKR